MRPTLFKLQYRLAATLGSLAAYSAVLLSAPAFAHTTDGGPDLTALATNDAGSNVTFGSGGGQFPFELGSYNGLVLEDSTDEGADASLDPIRRARRAVSSLGNNQYQEGDIKPGETQKWYFPKDAEFRDGEGDPKEEGPGPGPGPSHQKRMNTVYVSMTICSKPRLAKRDNDRDHDPPPALPQLDVAISGLSSPEGVSDPERDGWSLYRSEEGYMSAVGEAAGDVHLEVKAPPSKDYEGSYHYQIAASVDAYFHTVGGNASLFPVDTDATAALLTTDGINETRYGLPAGSDRDGLDTRPPFVVFANNVNDPSIAGMERSYCALNLHAQIKGKKNVQASMTTRPGNDKLREQFYVTQLSRSSQYKGILAMAGNSTDSGNGVVGGGGRVWRPETFSTKNEDNCAIIHDLDFCTEVAYAVPSNPQKFKPSELRTLYDDHARNLYKNFTYSLAQIQCNATSNETRWSLTVDCDDCAKAYRDWLCAVTIPRCADFSSPNVALHPRNINQLFHNGTSPLSSTTNTTTTSSNTNMNTTLRNDPASRQARNPTLDRKINPGPYKELLPCRDICWNLVRSCPSALDFSCPEGPRMSASYGVKVEDREENTCNYPGAPFKQKNGAAVRYGGLFGWGGMWMWGLVWLCVWL